MAVIALGWLDLTTTGEVWTVVQGVVVGVFAALQVAALRTAR